MALEMKSSSGLSKSCILIIVVASVERFAYKGVASNLLSYLTHHVKMSTSSAAKSVSTWSGVTSMLPLASAILADSYWDRYSTITVSSLLYIMGFVGLTSWALLCAWMPTSSLFLPLYLISLGQGGYNPSLQAFGADQLDTDDERSNKKSLFFQWWYFGICSGSLLGNSIMSYIQDTFGWGLGFAIPTCAMAVSVACFLCSSRVYVHKIPDRPYKFRSKSLIGLENDAEELELQAKPLGSASDCTGGDVADEPPGVAKTILRLLPIWTMLLTFAVIFQQPLTFFTKQGMMMKHSVGQRRTIVIPPAMLQSAITMSIILIMPLYDKLIIPFLHLLTGKEKGITVLQRIGIGMCLSVIAMVVAAVVESKRIRILQSGGMLLPHDQPLQLESQLSIFWLLPQYILLGISDVFTVVGMQEFFYMEVPATMRTIGIALYLSVFGFGSFLSALLISVLEFFSKSNGKNQSWFSDDIREARLDSYYWFLASLSAISFLAFAYLCRHYNNMN
ncbi:protein NRT1/ PTR FAMILY 5.8-like [Zingiber officinale]|uniref:Uncharacterized protein n=1 Tax=Zingiber officinale TaxID=94328 RepID=A0A8J5HQQ7_ZINOF|nr:protein NRT1/ PTR FAMILY 5.8-like [Zingiber officinale]KAG6528998.1 hypothetical protein ZIOFF_011190 [Zingiber officinale]